MLTAQEISKRYQDSMSSASTKERYKQGVAKVTESPAAKAATPAAMALYLQRVQESVENGTRERALLNSPLAKYKNNAGGKGADRLQTGAKQAETEHLAILAKWAPVYEQAKEAAAALPKGDLDAGMARCRAAAEVMKKAAGKM